MTYQSLLSAIYANYDQLWAGWNIEMDRAGDVGVYTFLPEGYDAAASLDDAVYSYWTIDKVRDYLDKGGQSCEDLESLVDDVSVAEEFLVMIIESPDDSRGRPVHVHRIARVGFN